MGWWQIEDGRFVGDGALDITEDFLRQISNEYFNELGRKPSLAEVLVSLETVLYNRADEFTQDSEATLVTAISAKTKRRPKKQLFQPGDVFAIPLDEYNYGFGRVTPQAGLLEYFELTKDHIPSIRFLQDAKRFFFPFMTSSDALEEWQWKVIGNLPFAPGEFKVHPFRIGDKVASDETVVDDGFIDVTSQLSSVTAGKLTLIPDFVILPPEIAVKKLREKLKM